MEMRRKDREITALSEILTILKTCKVCRLAMTDAEGLYIVPLNFAYEIDAKGEEITLKLFFHGASVGRKISAMKANPTVCFEMDCEHCLVEGAQMTDYSYRYKSIIGNGIVSFIEDDAQRMDVMVKLMQHQTGFCAQEIRTMPYEQKYMKTDAMAVFTVEVTNFTAKFHA